ncbi:transcription factor TFIIIB component B'' homolog [Drosophila guanche]|uniref:Blast:Transcription factor TFIIIB component B'' homolog n=1 Tax=Drosophila guanche TaxID=7266 RepID=A0A3B0JXH8_DROGU|nr:transcription factor TFIIIB component B'' homolog [Drosophila guanche]XP_034135223.1 transcription factor TFIIIB component B'' homolog [Drosophila guanche]SPP85773.1 blast:Transcription factor TFIIIB component B'' homolog [Drosophila guanche]
MSMRRQRFKAMANLSHIKRKARKEDLQVPKEELEEQAMAIGTDIEEEAIVASGELEDADAMAFKMPVSSAGQLEEVFHSDIEDNVIQMDLQKTANGFPMSPSKTQARQRVRPTPVFGQRRNSFVGSPMAGDYDGDYQSPGTPTRRERYLSGSSMGTPQQVASPMPPSPFKYFPPVMSPGMGRIRTESTCSAYSEGGGKQRKGDDKSQVNQSGQRVNARRDFETRFNNGIPDKSTFKMFDMIFYNPLNNPMEQKPLITTIKAESSAEETKPTPDQLMDAKEEATSAMPVPQLKLDANGEMIIDEKTLEIETTAEVEARKVLANSSLILMDETTGDNGFYKRHRRTPYWSAEETVRFYRSLQIIGTDFSLMCQMFPQRTRRDLKLKYKREERTNSQLINKALLYPKAFNIQELKDQLEQEDRDREEKERKWHDIMSAQAGNTKKRTKLMGSKAARSMNDGDTVYENEHVTKKMLGKHAWAKRCKALEPDENDGTGAVKRKPRQRLSKKKQMEANQPSLNSIKEEAVIKTEQTGCNNVNRGELQEDLNALLSDDQEFIVDISKTRDKTIINMDDGTLSYVSDVEPSTDGPTGQPAEAFIIDFIADQTLPLPAANTDEPVASTATEHGIEKILSELAEGSLVLVSSLDPENENRVVNEIYMYDKNTGDLCESPLNIPEHIVQCIMNVMQLED